MIWFFLAGMIAGAAGVILVLRWWVITHVTFMENSEEEETDE